MTSENLSIMILTHNRNPMDFRFADEFDIDSVSSVINPPCGERAFYILESCTFSIFVYFHSN